MRIDELRNSNVLATFQKLRAAIARVIDEANLMGTNDAQAAADMHAIATQLQAAAVVVDSSAATNATAPVVSSLTGAFAAKTITVTYDKALAAGYTPAAADFTITSPDRPVASVAYSAGAGTVTITYTGDQLITADTPLLTYVSRGLRGVYGTPVASYTAQAVTVAGS